MPPWTLQSLASLPGPTRVQAEPSNLLQCPFQCQEPDRCLQWAQPKGIPHRQHPSSVPRGHQGGGVRGDPELRPHLRGPRTAPCGCHLGTQVTPLDLLHVCNLHVSKYWPTLPSFHTSWVERNRKAHSAPELAGWGLREASRAHCGHPRSPTVKARELGAPSCASCFARVGTRCPAGTNRQTPKRRVPALGLAASRTDELCPVCKHINPRCQRSRPHGLYLRRQKPFLHN